MNLFDPQNSIDKTRKSRIKYLNDIGIFDVESFIKLDIASTVKTIDIRRELIAIQHILRYKYKGEPLVTDFLLDKILGITHHEAASYSCDDYEMKIGRKLGFDGPSFSLLAQGLALDKMKANDDCYSFMEIKRGGANLKFKQDYYEVSVMEILNCLAQRGNKLAQFYVNYQKEKKAKENQQYNSSESLGDLKDIIAFLEAQRDALDAKIRQLTEQAQTIEGGKIVNEGKQY